MKHRHADLMLLFANDAQETDKPWKRWEYYCVGGKWLPLRGTPVWDELINYRRIKPKTDHQTFVEYMDDIAEVAFKSNPYAHDVDVTASKGIIHIDTNEFDPIKPNMIEVEV